MKRTEVLQGIRKMRFEEAYEGWTQKRLSQSEAARLLGICDRTFRRYILRYEADGIAGLADHRLNEISHLCAPVDEVIALNSLYETRYFGWNVKHFFRFYQRHHQGTRSYTWVKNTLQKAGSVEKSAKRGAHRKRRPRAVMPGMMLHQDGSTHEWISGQKWDLIITFDDATSEHYSMFFVEQEGTVSSLLGVKETIEKMGLFCSFYSDRGSHYWLTPEVNGPVDKQHFTQFRHAMHQLGIEMIAAYSPEARGRCERAFRTHQGRLPQELALAGITMMEQANVYLKQVYMPAYNMEFTVAATESGNAFVEWIGGSIDEYLCEQYERVVGKDNCVQFERMILQIPANCYRFNYVKTRVKVRRYIDGTLAIFHGPRLLARYDNKGQLGEEKNKAIA